MPIEVQHQPPLNIVGKGGYEAGLMSGYAQRRSEVEAQQMQYDQMRQQRVAQMMNMWSQQQAQNAALQRDNMNNLYAQQNQAAQMAQQQAMAQQQQQDKMAYLDQQHQNTMAGYTQRADMNLWDMGHQSRAQLDTTLGSIDSGMLSDVGRTNKDSIQSELSRINGELESGSLKARDYYYAINELNGRAKQLSSPTMYAPPRDPMKEMNEGFAINPRTQRWNKFNPETKGWEDTGDAATVHGNPINEPIRYADGSVMIWNNKGEADVRFDAPKRYEEIQNQAEADMIKIANMYKPSGGGGTAYGGRTADPTPGVGNAQGGTQSTLGPRPSWMNHEPDPEDPMRRSPWQQEWDRRVAARWTALTETAWKGTRDAVKAGSPEADPTTATVPPSAGGPPAAAPPAPGAPPPVSPGAPGPQRQEMPDATLWAEAQRQQMQQQGQPEAIPQGPQGQPMPPASLGGQSQPPQQQAPPVAPKTMPPINPQAPEESKQARLAAVRDTYRAKRDSYPQATWPKLNAIWDEQEKWLREHIMEANPPAKAKAEWIKLQEQAAQEMKNANSVRSGNAAG